MTIVAKWAKKSNIELKRLPRSDRNCIRRVALQARLLISRLDSDLKISPWIDFQMLIIIFISDLYFYKCFKANFLELYFEN